MSTRLGALGALTGKPAPRDRRRALRLLAGAPEGLTEAQPRASSGAFFEAWAHARRQTHDGGCSHEDHGGGMV